ncbi:MAG TPA: hypothetical protein VGM56_07915 [Byssovorax sp.]
MSDEAALDPRPVARLAHKYARLVELRRDRARGEPIPERGVFRALAREFPGVLAELDTLPMELLVARADEASRAAAGDAPEPTWIRAMIGYHALFRAALYVKLRVARASVDDARAEALALQASARSGATVDAAFVRAVVSPPRGRLATLVVGSLAAQEDLEPAELRRLLFPAARRPDPPVGPPR